MSVPLPSFLRDGLRFECTGCGDCCTGAPGQVRFLPEELQRMAEHLDLSTSEFRERYCRPELLELKEEANGDCVLFQEGLGCRVHEVKPGQCRRYPFWFKNLRNEEAWQRCAAECEGVGQGRLWSAEEMLALMGEEFAENSRGRGESSTQDGAP